VPTYSFGEDSPLKFTISDKTAELYNQAVEQFFKAQTRFNQKFGRRWDPSKDPIAISWTKKQRKAWDRFADVFNDVVQSEGPFHVNDIMDDFLVKNAVSAASVAPGGRGRAITLAAGCGALYVLLRGL
jgi:hypothetical protein